MALLVSGSALFFPRTKLRILVELTTHNFTGKQIPLLHNKYLHIAPFIPTPSSGLKNAFVYNSYMFRFLYQCQHQDKKSFYLQQKPTCIDFYINDSIRITILILFKNK